jgi:N-acetylmuramic acid 6-phosphate etherase
MIDCSTFNMRKKREKSRDPWRALATEAANPASRDLDLMKPAAIVRLINREDRRAVAAVGAAADAIAAVAERFAAAILGGGRVAYLGAGTSGRMGTLDASELPPTFGLPFSGPGSVLGIIAGGPRALRRSVEGAEDSIVEGAAAIRRGRLGQGDLVIGISASSLAPYVRAALGEAKRRGAVTALVTMNRVPQPAFVDHLIVVETGPEVLAGSTRMKSGLATKAVLHAISTTAMILCGKVYGNRMIDLRAWCAKLEARAHRLIEDIGGVSPHRAQALFRLAAGDVKSAIVMARLGVARSEAARLLQAADGSLRKILGGKQRNISSALRPPPSASSLPCPLLRKPRHAKRAMRKDA